MSKLSKYYRVTNHLLIEYVTDQTPQNNGSNTEYYIYTGNDNNTYYIENIHNNDLYINQLCYLRLPDESQSEYFYNGIPLNYDNTINKNKLNVEDILNNLQTSGHIKSFTTSPNNKVPIAYDKIRIHLIYGFTLDNLTGFNLQASVLCSTLKPKQKTSGNHKLFDKYNNPIFETIEVYRNNGKTEEKILLEPLVNQTEEVMFLDMYFPKELLQNATKWHKSALYQNGSFYDRYIEVELPSPQYLSMNTHVKLEASNIYGYTHVYGKDIPYLTKDDNTANGYTYSIPDYSASYVGSSLKYAVVGDNRSRLLQYTIPDNPEVILKFSTTSDGNSTSINDKDFIYRQTFYQDPINTISIQYKSNSDLFNIRIYEDHQNNEILYYPVYGEGNNVQDLDIDVMNEIESGAISMIFKGFYNDKDDMSEFKELYGENASKWIIYNDMSVTYNYSKIIKPLDSEETIEFQTTERFTNIIDYTDKTINDGQFWRCKYVPHVSSYNNYMINSICISYTCRLVNRLTSVECIRTATLLIDKPEKYVTKRIAINNVMTYKVINRIQRHDTIGKVTETITKDKYIRSYYNATNIVVSNTGNGTVYTQGQMILRLHRSSTNYMFKMYNVDEDNIRKPYDLTGPYKYKLIFPTSSGDKISIMPNFNIADTNLEIGQIVFYITEEQVKQIMLVPVNERYFAIVTDNDSNDGQQSTLYEGQVSYFN